MNITDAMTGIDIIRKTAAHFAVTDETLRQEIQAGIDEAWLSNDPNTKLLQEQLFPNGKPCPEDFILRIARFTQSEGSGPQESMITN